MSCLGHLIVAASCMSCDRPVETCKKVVLPITVVALARLLSDILCEHCKHEGRTPNLLGITGVALGQNHA